MRVQYILSREERQEVIDKMHELRRAAALSKAAGDMISCYNFRAQAEGMEKALLILGIIREQ
jgi:hypothetical protein